MVWFMHSRHSLHGRFVMTKIHPMAFGRKLNGAVDASISSRLRALQFLTPDDLGVVEHARDDKVLGLAQVRWFQAVVNGDLLRGVDAMNSFSVLALSD